jgi:acetoin utilization protein AcuB
MRLLDQIMSTPVETILPTASAAQARAAMQRARIRHLVVLSRTREIVGVLCAHDLRGAEPGSTVEEVMSAPAVTLAADADVQDAAKLLRRRNVGCLPLVDHGRLVGIVTTSDLLGLVGKGALRVQPRTTKWTMPKRGPTHRPEPRRP